MKTLLLLASWQMFTSSCIVSVTLKDKCYRVMKSAFNLKIFQNIFSFHNHFIKQFGLKKKAQCNRWDGAEELSEMRQLQETILCSCVQYNHSSNSNEATFTSYILLPLKEQCFRFSFKYERVFCHGSLWHYDISSLQKANCEKLIFFSFCVISFITLLKSTETAGKTKY